MQNRLKWVIYGVIPFILGVVPPLMYFSGHLVLQRLVCPKLPPLNPDAYREFGLVENLQNVLLLAIIVIFLAGCCRARMPRFRAVFGVLAAFSIFILLEEVDYGTHWYAFWTAPAHVGWFTPASAPEFQALLAQTDFRAEPFNIHNRGELTDLIKGCVSALMLGLFVVAPLCADRIRIPWLRRVVPDRFIIVTIGVMVLARFITRSLGALDESLLASAQAAGQSGREAGAMGNNLSEFREVLTYYVFLVYSGALVLPVLRAERQGDTAPQVEPTMDVCYTHRSI